MGLTKKISQEYTGDELLSVLEREAKESNIYKPLPHTTIDTKKSIFLAENLGIFPPQIQYKIIEGLIESSSPLKENEELFHMKEQLKKIIEDLPENYSISARLKLDSLLTEFPNVKSLWDACYKKKGQKDFRGALDDARLALEELIKKLLKNNKSLENQKNDLGRILNSLNVPKEISQAIIQSLKSYSDIQNNHVKHGIPEELTDLEVNFILNETYALSLYLVQKLNNN